jgi:glycosyltransferase involved in cell wall biosynthesis
MRILQLTHQFPPEHVGGVELITQMLSQQLAERGHGVSVLTRAPVPEPARLWGEGFEVFQLPEHTSKAQRFVSTLLDSGTIAQVRGVFDAVKPDLVHAQHWMSFPADLMNLFDAANVPVVISLHDYWYVCANAQRITNDTQEICDGPDTRLLNCGRCMAARAQAPAPLALLAAPIAQKRNAEVRDLLIRARAVVANSHYVLDWFTAQQFDTEAWHLVRYGIDRPPEMQRLATSGAKPFQVTYIGGLSWQKGVHVLIEAFNALPEDASLVIVGDERAFPDYVSLLRSVATHPWITFTGPQSREQVWQTLTESDVVCVPALWHETASLITLEALAAGCHVIASDVGAIGEAIVDASSGELVPPGDVNALRDALMRAYAHRPTQTTLPEWRTPDAYADDIEAIYAQVLAGS